MDEIASRLRLKYFKLLSFLFKDYVHLEYFQDYTL